MTNSLIVSRILVGVDGSDASIEALRWATYEAGRRDVPMLIVSCYSVPVYGMQEAGIYQTCEDVAMFEQGAATIVREATKLVAEIDPHVVVEVMTVLSAAAVAIADTARAGDEIVVGATGHSGFMDGVLGSVATSVVHRSQVPVIVVPAKPVVDAGVKMRKIVIGLDGSPASIAALDWAYEQALFTGAELTAVHGWIYPYPGQRTVMSSARAQMELDAMEQLKTSLESLGVLLTSGPVEVHPRLVEKSALDALLDEADDADLVVIGSRGRGALRSSLFGSVGHSVAQHANCPVVIIRELDE
jgi:nucleotide-binding universal stress UspA family protein